MANPRIESIFLNVRDTLNDHQKQRWPDTTLLRYLNLAIRDIAKQSHLFKNSTSILLKGGQDVYELPDNILELSHATYDWKPLPLVSSGWMTANREADWRYTTTDDQITHIVFDEVRRRQIRVYPRPFGPFSIEYEVLTNPYGVLTDLTDHTLNNVYGVLSFIADPEINNELTTSVYGVTSAIYQGASVQIYYTECPALPQTIDDELVIDDCFDMSLKFYICGTALRNDIDLANRQMATEEFALYERDLETIKELAQTDSVSAPHFETPYNPLGSNTGRGPRSANGPVRYRP